MPNAIPSKSIENTIAFHREVLSLSPAIFHPTPQFPLWIASGKLNQVQFRLNYLVQQFIFDLFKALSFLRIYISNVRTIIIDV